MPEESTTPDLVERTRQLFEAANAAADRRDIDELMRPYATDAVFASVAMGTSFEGIAALREFFKDWFGLYEEWESELGEIIDLGSGVTLSKVTQNARLVGSTGHVQIRQAWVIVWLQGLVVQATVYPEADIDEARAAAERLAQERADG